MVEQGKLVGGEGLPAIGSADRRARLAGVALVHRNHAETAGQLRGRIERTAMPEVDHRAHPTRRNQQERITGTVFLVIERYISVLKGWHRFSSGLKYVPK